MALIMLAEQFQGMHYNVNFITSEDRTAQFVRLGRITGQQTMSVPDDIVDELLVQHHGSLVLAEGEQEAAIEPDAMALSNLIPPAIKPAQADKPARNVTKRRKRR